MVKRQRGALPQVLSLTAPARSRVGGPWDRWAPHHARGSGCPLPAGSASLACSMFRSATP